MLYAGFCEVPVCSKRRTSVVKVLDNYGLCNRLFPFAHLLAAAAEYGWRLRHAAFSEFAEYFEGTSGCWHSDDPQYQSLIRKTVSVVGAVGKVHCRLLRKINWHRCISLEDHQTCDLSDPVVRQMIESQQLTQLAGLYFYDSTAFARHADLVRQYFRPVLSVRELVSECLSSARLNADLVVGVHIRHGDYQTFCNGIMYYTFAEYAALMRLVEGLFPGQRVSFLICSNGAPPEEEFRGLRIHQGPGHVVGDVYALAECDYIVGPPSTYSEWASFYGQVPRYMHRAKDYEWNGQAWPGVTLQDFVVHTEGFARCNPGHPASLIRLR